MTKTEQFWSIGEMLPGKEAGNLQQSRKNNTSADRNGEVRLSQKQKYNIHGEKQHRHNSSSHFKSQAFLLVKFPRVIVYGTAKENLERGSDHKTGK